MIQWHGPTKLTPEQQELRPAPTPWQHQLRAGFELHGPVGFALVTFVVGIWLGGNVCG